MNRICEKPKAELRLADGKSNFDENLPTQSYTDEKPLAGKLHKSQSGPLEKKFSSQRLPNGICNFNENQQTQNKTGKTKKWFTLIKPHFICRFSYLNLNLRNIIFFF